MYCPSCSHRHHHHNNSSVIIIITIRMISRGRLEPIIMNIHLLCPGTRCAFAPWDCRIRTTGWTLLGRFAYTHLGSFTAPSGRFPPRKTTPQPRNDKSFKNWVDALAVIHVVLRGSPSRYLGRLFKSTGVEFVGDHMQPKSVADQLNQRFYRRLLNFKVSFRFYPQCTVCSDRQGALLSQATAALRKHQTERATSTIFKKLGNVGRGQPSLPQFGRLDGRGQVVLLSWLEISLSSLDGWPGRRRDRGECRQ